MRRILKILLAGAVCLVSLTGCPGTGRYVGPTYTIQYTITGSTGSVRAVFADTQEGYGQAVVTPPWSYQFTADAGQHVYLQAQNLGSGTMTLTVYKDGTASSTQTFSSADSLDQILDLGSL